MTVPPPGDLIAHVSALPAYSPPGHSGTVNRRLVERGFGGGFEMILGVLEPGGVADRHSHAVEHQAIYILDGEAEVTLGDGPAARCGAGTIVRIPPGLDHEVVNVGAAPLILIVLYSPPLAPRPERPVPG